MSGKNIGENVNRRDGEEINHREGKVDTKNIGQKIILLCRYAHHNIIATKYIFLLELVKTK